MSFPYQGQATVDFYFDLVNQRDKESIESHEVEVSEFPPGKLTVRGFPDPYRPPMRIVLTLADGRVFDGAMSARSNNIFTMIPKD